MFLFHNLGLNSNLIEARNDLLQEKGKDMNQEKWFLRRGKKEGGNSKKRKY